MTLFEQYLNQVRLELNEQEVDFNETVYEEIEGNNKQISERDDKGEPEEDSGEDIEQDSEEGDREEVKETPIDLPNKPDPEVKPIEVDRQDIIISWLKALNAKFKPDASFKITIEKNEEDKDEIFLSLKPFDSETQRYFYNLTRVEKLNEKIFNDIIELAEKQLLKKSAESGIVENTLNIRAIKGWKKKKNDKAIIEFKTSDNKKTLEVITEDKRGNFNLKKKIKKHAILYFNEDANVYQILEDNIDELNLKDKLLKYMDSLK